MKNTKSSTLCLGTKPLNREKSRSLVRLSETGLPVPNTVIGTQSDSSQALVDCTKAWIDDSFYIRLCRSDTEYPHYYYRLSTRSEMLSSIKELVNKALAERLDHYDIILQPLLLIESSAALVLKKDVVLLEEIDGAPMTLLRDGYFQRRIFFSRTSHEKVESASLQPTAIRYQDRQWIQSNTKVILDKDDEILPLLAEKLPSSGVVQVLELGWINQEPFFLDLKTLPANSYECLDEFPPVAPFVVNSKPVHSSTAVRHVERPALDNLDSLGDIDQLIISTGALTSHLCVHMAQVGTGCVVMS